MRLLLLLVLASSFLWTEWAHETYIRNYLDSRTFRLKGERGSGTGFLVKAPSGKDYILTNRHVCEIGQLWLDPPHGQDKRPVKLTQIEVSEKTDLCILAAPAYLSDGLDLAASEPDYDDGLAITGHPGGSRLPILSRGVFLEKVKVLHPWEEIKSLEGLQACQANPDRVVIVDWFWAFCGKMIDSYKTTVVIFGGNSGSAVVNFWGKVVGVAWGANTRTNHAVVVPLDDVKEFLEIY